MFLETCSQLIIKFNCYHISKFYIITTRKRSLQRLYFHRCLSVHREVSAFGPGGGVCHTPWEDPSGQTPPGQTPLPIACWDTPPASACWDTVNKRALRIPLECILVLLVMHCVYEESRTSIKQNFIIVIKFYPMFYLHKAEQNYY